MSSDLHRAKLPSMAPNSPAVVVVAATALSWGCAPTASHFVAHDYFGPGMQDGRRANQLPPVDDSYAVALDALRLHPISNLGRSGDAVTYRILVDHVLDVRNMTMWDG